MRALPRLRFAGQITGVEVMSKRRHRPDRRAAGGGASPGRPFRAPPATTAHGALINHITGGHIAMTDGASRSSFQPMNVNFGLFPPVTLPRDSTGKRLRGAAKQEARKRAYTGRALSAFCGWLETFGP